MARHRDIRNMDYSEDYDGYDDVYGHSVDDDYCISPSNGHFIFNRDSLRERSTQEKTTESSEKASIEESKFESSLSDAAMPVTETINVEKEFDDNITEGIDLMHLHERIVAGDGTKIKVSADQTTCIKLVASSGKTSKNVTKGFDLDQNESMRLNSILSSKRNTPAYLDQEAMNTPSRNSNKVDIMDIYRKERGYLKDHLYMVVIGHVDAGKSTLMGHLLYNLGQVNQKTMHKYEQESRKLGKQSFVYAWVLDETGEERTRGITMDVGRCQFETKTKVVTILDAPGHKDFIPNMISGASQADVALLVVDATRGEFETGFDFGGQTREHALLVRSLGVIQLAVAINKLDTVSWSEDRFHEISQKLWLFLKQAGFRQGDITFIPCSGLTGENLTGEATEPKLLDWYNGPCLLDVIDKFKTPERPVEKVFRFSVNDVYKGTGTSGFYVSGRVESGTLSVGDVVMVCPSKKLSSVKSLLIETTSQSVVFAGDQSILTLSGIEMENVQVGDIICDPQNPIEVANQFQAKIVVFNLTVPMTKGFSAILHHQSLVEPIVVSKLISELNKNTGEVIKKRPRYLKNNSSAIVEIQSNRLLALELYSDCKQLGRIMLRIGGVTVAAGLVTKINLQ